MKDIGPANRKISNPRGNPASSPYAFACNEARLLLAVFGYQIHARPARRPRTRDRHRVEPEAASRAGGARPGALHRLRPPDRHDRERGFPAPVSPGPAAQAPARTLGVASTTGAELKGARLWHPCARDRDPPGPFGRPNPENTCGAASWGVSWGQAIRSPPGEPDRLESSATVGLGEITRAKPKEAPTMKRKLRRLGVSLIALSVGFILLLGGAAPIKAS